jgi:hypothetical protein
VAFFGLQKKGFSRFWGAYKIWLEKMAYFGKFVSQCFFILKLFKNIQKCVSHLFPHFPHFENCTYK